MRISTIGSFAALAMLAFGSSPAAAASAPIAASALTAHCHGKASASFGARTGRINVMGATQLDNTWVAAGTAAVGRGQSDFMCTYDSHRRFIEMKRLD